MDRREAMLRELNLYPLWVRRDLPVAAQDELPVVAVSNAAGAENPAITHRVAPEAIIQASEVNPALDAVPPHVRDEMPDSSARVSETDIFSLSANHEAATENSAIALQARKDSLLEFQRKHAGGALARLDWPELKEKVQDCNDCGLRAGCTQPVFGVGDEHADWLFVGEAPGAEEDARNEPFVGESGKLLDNMLMAIKLRRGANVYIANVVKCRPPQDRTPHIGEIAACLPYLKRQIGLLQPKLIVAMGKTAATSLLNSDATLATLRGRVYDYAGIPLIVTYHPAYLLRKPTEKASAWEDLCLAVETMKGLAG